MASSVYPDWRHTQFEMNYEQARKLVCNKHGTKTRNPGGHIIAKGNIIEGIEAKE